MKRFALFAMVAVAAACGSDPADPTPEPPAPTDRPPSLRSHRIDGRPSAVVVASKRAFVADDEDHEVHVLNGAGLELRDPIDVPQNPIAMVKSDRFVWVGHAGGELTRIDAVSYESTTFEGTGSITDVVAGGQRVWTVDLERRTVSEIDRDDGQVVREREVEDGAVRGIFARGSVWVSGVDTAVTRLDADTLEVEEVYEDVGPGPIGLASDGEIVWAAVSELDAIVDVEGRTFDEPVDVGRGPTGVVVAGPIVLTINQDDRSLTWLEDGEVTTIDLGALPRDLAVGDSSVWVAGVSTNQQASENVVARVSLARSSGFVP